MTTTERKQIEYKRISDALPEQTSAQKARKALCLKYLENLNDSGRFGRIDELISVKPSSRKTRVSKQGKTDITVRFHNGNKVVNKAVERKTNGGRIEDLIQALEKGNDKLIAYKLDYTVKHPLKDGTINEEIRKADIIALFSQFYAMLNEVGAIKWTNGNNNERAIQVSSKKMYDRLLDWVIPFDVDSVYSMDDFEGLEM